MDSSEDDDFEDQSLLNIKIAGSAYSTLPEQAPGSEGALSEECTLNRQPLLEDDDELLNVRVAGSSYVASGVSELVAETSIQQPEGPDTNADSMAISGVPTLREFMSRLPPPAEVDQELAGSPHGVMGTEDRCNSGSRESEPRKAKVQPESMQPVVRSSPYFSSSEKKPTFSLQSLNKYIMGSV